MNKNQVYCCGFSEDGVTISQIYIKSKKNKNEIVEEAGIILDNLQGVLKKKFDRKMIEGRLGKWCATKLTKPIQFCLTDTDYPDRLAFKLLKDLNNSYEDYLTKNDLKILKQNGNKLLEKFNKPESFDKLTKANKQVNNLKQNMYQNIDKLTEGQDQLSDLEEQTNQFSKKAQDFQNSTKSVKRTLWFSKYKLTLYIILLVIIIVAIVALLSKVF